tara:strand:- start:42 stop:638 length:597 start_codon:yes stop_codon:yes gene_type:complete
MPITLNGSGTITGVSVGGLPDGIVDTDMIAAAAVTGVKKGAGSILQVVQTVKSDVFSSTSQTYVDITGLTVDITPVKANSNILVIAIIGTFGNTDVSNIALTTADGTAIIQGDIVSGKDSASTSAYTGGNSTGEGWYGNNPAPIIKLHDPSYTLGNAVTYKCRMKCNGNTFYLNRNQSDVSQYAVRTASTITAMEIAV